MQPHSSPPPFGRPSAAPSSGPPLRAGRPDKKEFADALGRMFEKRERLGLDAAQLLPDKDEQWEESSSSFLSSLAPGPALRRALSIVPLAVIGFAVAWYFYFDPS